MHQHGSLPPRRVVHRGCKLAKRGEVQILLGEISQRLRAKDGKVQTC